MSRLLGLGFLIAVLSVPFSLGSAHATAPTDYERVMNAANNDPDNATTDKTDSTPVVHQGYNPNNISIYGQPQFHQSPGISTLIPAPNQMYGSRFYNSSALTATPAITPLASNVVAP